MDRIGRDCRDRTDDILLHPCATTRMPPLDIVNLAGAFFGPHPARGGSTVGKQRSFPTRPAAPPTRQAYHGHLSHDTGWTAVNSKEPLVAGNRNGEQCRGTRRPADPTCGRSAYWQKSGYTGVDPGSVCAVSFHGSLWHTEDLRQAVCLHFGDNHGRLIESALFYRGRAS
jgi:hypothetical protein